MRSNSPLPHHSSEGPIVRIFTWVFLVVTAVSLNKMCMPHFLISYFRHSLLPCCYDRRGFSLLTTFLLFAPPQKLYITNSVYSLFSTTTKKPTHLKCQFRIPSTVENISLDPPHCTQRTSGLPAFPILCLPPCIPATSEIFVFTLNLSRLTTLTFCFLTVVNFHVSCLH